jgi:5-methyltetrahydrofolate--homocysteine methyltransferase
VGLAELIDSGAVVFDGAMGTLLQSLGLPAGGCPELWCLENPEGVFEAHRRYIEAGAQIVETNTFGATPIRLSHYGLAGKVEDINRAAVRIAKRAAGQKALVAGSVGPLGVLVEPLGSFTFDEAYEQFAAQVKALKAAGVDAFIVETIADLNEMRAAILACKDTAPEIPLIAQMTIDPRGRSYTGTTPESAALVMQAMGADVIGLNCSVGPDVLVGAIEKIARVARVPVSAQPNAGLPRLVEGKTVFPMGPEEFASYGPRLVAAGARIVGGCCGTTPEHIRLLREAVAGLKPVAFSDSTSVCRGARPGDGAAAEDVHSSGPGSLSGVLGLTSRTQSLFFTEDRLPIIIGERINPTGRKALSRDIKEGVFGLVRKEAKRQVEAGAHILDVNVGVPLIDEAGAMKRAVRVVQEVTRVPVSIDSVSPEAVEAGLREFVGRAIINSVTAEEAKAAPLLRLAKRYGAAVIGLTMDETGLPSSAEERVRLARRIVEMAGASGIPPCDILIDPLALTAGAQQDQAKETLRAISLIKELGCLTSLGVSNVSFGLPNRDFLNAVYLNMALAQGLDAAIVNPAGEHIAGTVRAVRVFLNRDAGSKEYISAMEAPRAIGSGPAGEGSGLGPGSKENPANARATGAAGAREDEGSPTARPSGAATRRNLDSEEDSNTRQDSLGHAIYSAVLEGDKAGLIPLLDRALSAGADPMQVLNDWLIPAITETGRLFADGTYFLPQLMLSAEAMKAAFEMLKPELAKRSQGLTERGTVVLATVEGDVHDIGKNLVAILLENHGLRVYDLGRDVPASEILAHARKVRADAVCLSALMTTTMPRMKEVIDLFASEGFECPVLVGGAATTEAFAREIGASGYGRDAQEAVTEVLRVISTRGER